MSKVEFSDGPILCLHCGNETIMEVLSRVEDKEIEYMSDPRYGKTSALSFYSFYTIYKCHTCLEVTLRSIKLSNQDYEYFEDEFAKYENYLYPVQTGNLSFVPFKIRNAYESALKVKKIDSVMCAIGLRRTLEMICHNQNAKGKTLFDKLDHLSSNGIIPEVLDDASHLIRTIGNSAAHDVDVKFNKKIVEDMLRFTRIILEYVYVIPKEIDKIQKHFERIKENGRQKAD